MSLNPAGLQVKLPDAIQPEPTLLVILQNYFAMRDSLTADVALARAQAYMVLLNDALVEHDPCNQFTAFCVAQWGDGRLPDDLREELGDESTWTERERMLVKRFTVLRSDYLIATGISGETGEIEEVLKKSMRVGTWNGPAILDETGDALYYHTVNLKRHGYSLQEAMAYTQNKLTLRRGPAPEGVIPPWA